MCIGGFMKKFITIFLLLFSTTAFAQIGGGIFGVPSQPIMTPLTSATGRTVQEYGKGDQQQLYKVTITYTGWVTGVGSATGDITIGTIPAKAKLKEFYSDTTVKYVGGGNTAATLVCGVTAGTNEILASHDVFTAVTMKGLADADLGTSMVRSAAIQGGYTPSWTVATTIVCRLTTTTAHTDDLTQGSTTFYMVVEGY
jgi:hypothetical protein